MTDESGQASAAEDDLGSDRAREGGQLRGDTDAEAVVDQLWGACHHRLLIPDQPLTTRFADTLVAQLVEGLRPPDTAAGPPARA